MIDITEIPSEELLIDFAASVLDIEICRLALSVGITQYSAGSVQQRLDINRQIMEIILLEMARRVEAK